MMEKYIYLIFLLFSFFLQTNSSLSYAELNNIPNGPLPDKNDIKKTKEILTDKNEKASKRLKSKGKYQSIEQRLLKLKHSTDKTFLKKTKKIKAILEKSKTKKNLNKYKSELQKQKRNIQNDSLQKSKKIQKKKQKAKIKKVGIKGN